MLIGKTSKDYGFNALHVNLLSESKNASNLVGDLCRRKIGFTGRQESCGHVNSKDKFQGVSEPWRGVLHSK